MDYVKSILKFLTNRLFIIFFIFLFLFYMLISRLYELQIVDGKMYNEQFEKSVVREVYVKGLRGNIYDRYGFPLSENVLAYDVYLNDSYQVEDTNDMINKINKTLQKNGDKLLNFMPMEIKDNEIVFTASEKKIREFKRNVFGTKKNKKLTKEQVDMDAIGVYRYLRDTRFKVDKDKYSLMQCMDIINIRYSQFIRRYAKYKPEKIATNVSYKTVASLQENMISFPGITIEENPFRIYNDGEYFSHIVGYTREINKDKLEKMKDKGYKADDKVGFVGLEKEFEEELRGYDGYEKVEVNHLGKTMKVLEEGEPKIGNNVITTISHDLQIETYNIIEQNLAKILTENLYYSLPRKKDSGVLLKDVFDSVIRYELVDISEDNLSSVVGGKQLVEKANSLIEELGVDTEKEIKDRSKGFKKSNESMYFFILNTMVEDGYLKRAFYKSDYYDLFLQNNITFYQLMQALYDANLLKLDLYDDEVIYQKTYPQVKVSSSNFEEFEPDILIVQKINELVFDKIMLKDGIKKFYYLYVIDKQMIGYRPLCSMIIDLKLVSATERERTGLINGRYSPLGFIKKKILDLELRPKDLALDPSSGSAVITDVDTGEVLALVSYPTYDNNKFVNTFDGEYYNKLRKDPTKPLYPRATLSKSVPASTLKMAMGLAALTEGVVTPTETINATGIFNKIAPAARCWIYAYGGRHGRLSLPHAIERSCNYYFYEMAYRLGSKGRNGQYNSEQGIEMINKYLDIIGLSKKTGIEIGEATPNTPKLDPVRGAIGQEQNNYTPVGIARYINVLADGGRVKELNLVDKITDRNDRIVKDFTPKVLNEAAFAKEHVDVVTRGMRLVTSGSRGSAKKEFKGFHVKVAGKTGTAQIASFDDKNIDPVRHVKDRPNHALFVGFAPYEKPEVTVVVVLQYAYKSAHAAACARDVFENYFKLDKKIDDLDYRNQLW